MKAIQITDGKTAVFHEDVGTVSLHTAHGTIVTIEAEDAFTLVRELLTLTPLQPNDPRLKFIEELREMVIRQDDHQERWIVLDALRAVSVRKLRARRK